MLRKILLLIFCAWIIIPGIFAAEKWRDNDSEYCIEFMLPRQGAAGFWRIDNYAFPFDLRQGFTVQDEAGKKYNYNLDLRSRLLTIAAPGKANTKVYIYPDKKALEKVVKNRRYYMANRYFRDWNWSKDQISSQAVTIYLLSYETPPPAPKNAAKKAPVKKVPLKKTVAKKDPVKNNIRKKTAAKPKPVKKRPARPKRLPRVGHLPTKDFPDDTADLKKIFKYKMTQYQYRRNYPHTSFTRPIWWRLKGKYVARIDMSLYAPPGNYQFAVKTNDLVELYVDGKQVLRLNSKQASPDKWRETKLLKLSGAPIRVEAFYRSSIEKTHLVIGWRAKGEADYKFITQKDFIEANKIRPESLTFRDGQKLPVVKYQSMGYFQSGNKKQFLLGFETDFAAAKDKEQDKIAWRINGQTVDTGSKITMTFANKIPEDISCVINDAPPFKVILPESDAKNPGELRHRDLYVKINAPTFIYDDEVLDLAVEFHSELPIDMKAFLEGRSNSGIFENFKFPRAFTKTSNEPLFPVHDFIKKYFKLDGTKLKNNTELEFSIETLADGMESPDDGFDFDSKKIIFRKLAECSGLRAENGHFIDANGNRVIPILHRPTLDEKRAWSLLNALPSMLGEPSALIISDDFGGKTKLSGQLFENAEAARRVLNFADWNLEASDADFVSETTQKIKLIRESKSAVLIIIPSAYPILRGIPARLQQRLLAALIQTARNNKHIKRIILATPFPLAKPFAGNEILKTLLEDIQQLVTEEEIGFMSLPEMSSDDDAVLINAHPVDKVKDYADILIDAASD